MQDDLTPHERLTVALDKIDALVDELSATKAALSATRATISKLTAERDRAAERDRLIEAGEVVALWAADWADLLDAKDERDRLRAVVDALRTALILVADVTDIDVAHGYARAGLDTLDGPDRSDDVMGGSDD